MSQSTAFHTKNTVVYQHVAPVVNELFEVYIPEIENKIRYGITDWEPILNG